MEEDKVMAQVLTRFKPEEFDTAEEFDAVVYPELNRINPMKALKFREMQAKAFQWQQKSSEPFTLNPGDTRFGPDGKPIANVPVVPKVRPVEEEYYDPATTPERRKAIETQRSAFSASGRAPTDTQPPPGFTLNPGDTRYDAAGKVIATRPSAPTQADQGASLAQKGQAERWKQDRLAELEAQFSKSRAGGMDAQLNPIVPMTTEQLNRAKAEIQNSYLSQLGLPPHTLGGVNTGQSQAMAPPPAMASPMSAAPPAPPPVAAPPPVTGGPTDAALRAQVKSILAGAGRDTSDQAVSIFLANPTNRAKLGLR
ncbi:MAG: hypothetical protein Q7R45_13615 [Sulfuricaulis sp.]|nr:hypothetical protein [Sulfuricaulis sp.]